MSDNMGHELSFNPAVYVVDGDFPHGRIIAADFMGGSFDVNPGDSLSDIQTNALVVAALGYSCLDAAVLIDTTEAAMRNRLLDARQNLGISYLGTASAINESINRGIIRITRPSSIPKLQDERLDQIWEAISRDMSNIEIGHSLPIPIARRTVETYNNLLFQRLGVTNKAAATLLKHMAIEERKQPYAYTTERDNAGSRYDRAVLHGGVVEFKIEDKLYDDDSNVFLLAALGHTIDESRELLRNDELVVGARRLIKVRRRACEQLEAPNNMTLAIHNACVKGHIKLLRMPTDPLPKLSRRLTKLWDLMGQGLTNEELVNALNISPHSLTLRSSELCNALGLDGKRNTRHGPAVLLHHMYYPPPAMLLSENTCDIRQENRVALPNPRDIRKAA